MLTVLALWSFVHLPVAPATNLLNAGRFKFQYQQSRALGQLPSATPHARLDSVRERFQMAYNTKRFLDASALGLYAIEMGERTPSFVYNVACALSLAGDADRAFKVLDRAILAGFSDSNLIKTDSDLAPIRSDSRWPALVARAEAAAVKRHLSMTNPDRVTFITEDIPRFWNAYDLAMKAPKDQREGILQQEYLDKATPGMRDWILVRGVTAKRLATFIERAPKFMQAARPATLGFEKQRGTTIAAFKKFKSFYPEAEFPNVMICIGGFFGGGTVSDRSLLMSGEMYGGTPNVPVDELGSWEKTVLSANDDLPFVVAHEMIHFQQHYPDDKTLLRACIQEGSANFLGELCSGNVGEFHATKVYPYGNSHEKELWERFQMEMGRTDRQEKWLYSGSGEGVRPDDLGYYMGYKICEAYYKNATDKKRAVSDMLNIKSFSAFLKASGYAEKFGPG